MMKKALIVASFLLLPLLGTACRLGRPGGGWEYGHMMDYGFGYGGMFMWVIFLIVVVVAIYFIARALKEKNMNAGGQDTPLNILKKRYAKGEINKEEYDRMKRDLSE